MTNKLHPQDARTQSIMNRAIAARRRYEGKARHSRFWTPSNFIADRDGMPRRMGAHRMMPLPTPSTELPCAL